MDDTALAAFFRAMLAVGALALAAPAAAQTQGEMNRSAGESLSDANATLARTLGAYRERLEPAQQLLFDRSQEQWESYRDAACRFEASGVEGGSAHSLIQARCLARLAAERLKYLEGLSQCEEGDLACPAFRPRSQAPAPVDVFGYYFLEGSLPAWAKEIDTVHLATVEYRDGRLVSVPLWGLVRMKEEARPDYRIPAARLEGRRLSFATRAVDGVSFAFEGEFARLGNFPLDPPQGPVLQGRLRRLEHGRVTGELPARFRYEPGD